MGLFTPLISDTNFWKIFTRLIYILRYGGKNVPYFIQKLNKQDKWQKSKHSIVNIMFLLFC